MQTTFSQALNMHARDCAHEQLAFNNFYITELIQKLKYSCHVSDNVYDNYLFVTADDMGTASMGVSISTVVLGALVVLVLAILIYLAFAVSR